LGQELIKFSAARLATPLLFYHDRRTGATIRKNANSASEESASWDVIGCRFVNPSKDLHHVHALGLEGWNQKGGNQDDIHRSLIAKLSYHGVQSADDTDNDFGWSGHQSVYYPEDPNNLQEGETKDPVEAFELHLKQVKNKKDDLTLILLRNKDYAMYASMKRIADLEHGHPTSFAVGEKIKNLSGQVLSNLALKVNMNLGGVNHHLVDPDLGKDFVNRNQRLRTMVLGADVTHPAAASKPGCPSIACVVASVDEKVMKYLGSMRLQAGGQEVTQPPLIPRSS
jgi:eukaryotic translation initiation factor 2C